MKKINKGKSMSIAGLLFLMAVLMVLATSCSQGPSGGDSSAVVSQPTDTLLPSITSISPASNAANVAIDTKVTVVFSEAMLSDSITATSFIVYAGQTAIGGSVSYNAGNYTATLTLNSALLYSTKYDVYLKDDIKDLAGNLLNATNLTKSGNWFVSSFTTQAQPDTTAPTVSSVTPTDGATNVSISVPNISATFSENMDASTINSNNFTLATQAGAPITGTVAYDSANKKATFTASSNLSYSTVYTATIKTGVKDSAGNALAVQKTWSFTTASDPTGSVWTRVSPDPSFSGRVGFAAVEFKGELFIIGGVYDDNFTPVSQSIYKTSDGINWNYVPTAGLPQLSFIAAVAFNNGSGEKIWVIGEDKTTGINGTVEAVWSSPDGAFWTKEAINNEFKNLRRSDPHAVVFNNKLWVLGGDSSSTPYSDVWYSSDGANWTQATSNMGAGTARYYPKVAVFNNKMWMIGGSSGSGTFYNDVWYSSDGINWTRSNNALITPRVTHAVVVYQNKLRLIGGFDGNMSYNKADVWNSSDGLTWQKTTDSAAFGIKLHSEAVVFNNKIWLISGKDMNSDYKKEVWWSQ